MYSNAWHNTLCIAAVSVSLTEKQTSNIKSHPNLVISLPENMDWILRKVEKNPPAIDSFVPCNEMPYWLVIKVYTYIVRSLIHIPALEGLNTYRPDHTSEDPVTTRTNYKRKAPHG